MPRPGTIQIRASDEERAKWQAEAQAEGITLSDLIRRRMNEPDRVARLQEQVDRLAEDLASFREFFRNRTPRLPCPDVTPDDWEGQPDYKHPTE